MAANNYPTYAFGFEAQDSTIALTAWVDGPQGLRSNKYSGIVVYKPLATDGRTCIGDPMLYVPGDTVQHGDFYMRVNDIKLRTGNDAQSASLAKTELAESAKLHTTPFYKWSDSGDPDKVETANFPNPTPNAHHAQNKSEEERWSQVLKQIQAAGKRPYNVLARFWNPPLNNNTPYNVFVVPPPGTQLALDALNACVPLLQASLQHFQAANRYNVQVRTLDEVNNLGYRLVGHNFFDIYDTYMADAEYTRMLNATYTARQGPTYVTNDPWPIRSWPDAITAGTADSQLIGHAHHQANGRSPPRVTLRIVQLSLQTINNRAGAKRDQSQLEVMGGVSASDVNPIKISPKWNCEWLHRVAWSLGGDQDIFNLCFGTSECNTHMIRAENAVKTWVTRSKCASYLGTSCVDEAQPDRWLAHYMPSGNNTGQAPQFMAPGAPDWVPFSWAAPFMSYELMTLDDAGGQYTFRDAFDTFNRYVPLLLEAKLDDAVLNYLLDHHLAAAQLSSVDLTIPEFSASNMANEPSGLTLERIVNLFGIPSLQIEVYAYRGSLPPHVAPPRTGRPIFEQAKLPALSLGSIFPDLAGSPFDVITIQNATYTYQNCQYDSSKDIGWTLDCDATIGKSVGALHDVLRTLLGTDELKLHLSATFGTHFSDGLSWDKPTHVPSFSLSGRIDSQPIRLADNVTLVTVGVRLHAVRTKREASKPAYLTYAWELFGEMDITLPGRSTPLSFGFKLQKTQDMVRISGLLRNNIWRDVLGITGLHLDEVRVDIGFELSRRPKFLEISIAAVLNLKSSVVTVGGTYSKNSDISLRATWNHFSYLDLEELFHTVKGETLQGADMDISIGSASIVISKSSGLELTVFDVNVHDRYHVAEAGITINQDGIDLRAMFEGDLPIHGDSIILKNAELQLSLPFSGKSKNASVLIAGTTLCNLLPFPVTFEVSVYIYRDAGAKEGGGLQYTVYGSVSASESWSMGRLLGPLCPQLISDVSLRELSILAASTDNAKTGNFVIPGFRLKKGVQVCALIDRISEVDQIMKGRVPLLRFYASWPNPELRIELSLPSSLDFGHDVTTKPISIALTSAPSLRVEAGLIYHPSGRGSPLEFDLYLDLTAIGARVTAQAQLDWHEPLGIKNLTVKEVGILIGLRYADFLVRGPNELGIAGKFQVGSGVPDSIAVLFSDNPKEQLLAVSVHEVDIGELLRLTSQVLGVTSFPTLPPGAIICKEFDLYMCPAGATFGGTVYKPGFSAKLDMRIFDKSAKASLTINEAGFQCNAKIDNFSLGPFSVEGFEDEAATVDILWNGTEQRCHIDGTIRISNLRISTKIKMTPMPNAGLSFTLLVIVLGEFELLLEASVATSSLDWKNLAKSGTRIIFNGKFTKDMNKAVCERCYDHFHYLNDNNPQNNVELLARASDSSLIPAANALVAAESKWKDAQTTLLSQHTVYLQTLTDLCAKREQAGKEYHHALQVATHAHQAQLREHAATAQAAQFYQEKAEAAKLAASKALSDSLQMYNDSLRRKMGDPVAELNELRSEIAAITDELSSINSLGVASSTFPWTTSISTETSVKRRTLEQRLSLLTGYETMLVANTPTTASSDAETATVKSARDGLTEAQLEYDLVCAETEEQMTVAAEVLEAAELVLKETKTGPLFQFWDMASIAVTEHVQSRSTFFTDDGRLVDVTAIPEIQACKSRMMDYAVAVDASSHWNVVLESIKATIDALNELNEDVSQILAKLGKLLDQYRPGGNFITIKEIKVSGEINTGDADSQSAETVVMKANVTGTFCDIEFNHDVIVNLVDDNNLSQLLFGRIFNKEFSDILRQSLGVDPSLLEKLGKWVFAFGRGVPPQPTPKWKTLPI